MTEAENLKTLFEQIPSRKRAEFCRTYGIKGGVSMVYQHTNALKPISLEAAIGYAIGFNKPLEEISPRLAEILSRLPQQPEKGGNLYPLNHSGTAVQSGEKPPEPYRSLLNELQQHLDKMDDRGLILLIDKAEEIAARHPRHKESAA